ncbi:DUF6903 family protein [Paenibacillus camelliae]|uniref:DUF6903 family protein n=1 Tax=Paenibacillus camelliae TaxID=512410 RepID=UPI0020424E4E|nr:hypothetical protein [Paenibacillus camelliae]
MRILLYLILFVIGISLTIFGHRSIGPTGLAIMLAGLGVLVTFLWIYNRKHR